jgi:hypothetical protein
MFAYLSVDIVILYEIQWMIEMRRIACNGLVRKVCINVIELGNVFIASTFVMVNSTVLMVRMN